MNNSPDIDNYFSSGMIFAVLFMLVFFAFAAKFGWAFGKELATHKSKSEPNETE